MLRALLFALAVLTRPAAQAPQGAQSDYLFVWARDADSRDSDFLAVVDIAMNEVVATLPTGVKDSYAHHTEHEMPAGDLLFANGFGAGTTFIFDVSNPTAPRLAGQVGDAGPLKHAHSMVRLPNGNVLLTYQMADGENRTAGGLAEVAPGGKILRWSSAEAGNAFIRPYSLAIVPALNRAVSTTSDMHAAKVATSVQVWELSSLKLLHTIPLPPGPRGKEHHDPAEPRLLADGRTVLVNTFNCGLFMLEGLDSPWPKARLVHDFGAGECALPVVAGNYWVQTDTGLPGLVSLDVSNPSRPRIIDRLALKRDEEPHWISLAPDGRRIIVSGGNKALQSRLLIASIDPATGKLSLAKGFGLDFNRPKWPHGKTGPAVPHGAVFVRSTPALADKPR